MSLIYFGPPFSGPAFSVNPSGPIRLGCNDLEWPWKRDARGQTFLADFHNYVQTVWPLERRKLVRWHVGQKRVYRV